VGVAKSKYSLLRSLKGEITGVISGGVAKSKYSLQYMLFFLLRDYCVISGGMAKKLEQQLKCHSCRMPFLCFIRILSNAAQFEKGRLLA
jgi:hypothetical protein